MNVTSGSLIYDANGTSYRLSREIARGGEGAVWEVEGNPNVIAKLYLKNIGDDHVAKISSMCRMRTERLSSVAAWPISLLAVSRRGRSSGLLMRRVVDSQLIHQLYGLKSRLRTFPDAQLPFLIHVATNVARAFATIHAAGQVVGDVNHSNLMVARNGTVAMIDCDSFQITERERVYRCEVGVPDFTPPELQGLDFSKVTRTPNHDAFGLSVLIFCILFLGRHPFMGVYDRKSDDILLPDQAIGQYKFPYALGVPSSELKLPSFVPRLTDFPAEIGSRFVRSFTREAVSRGRPTAAEWVECLTKFSKTIKHCAANSNHHFYSSATDCPWCRMEGILGTPIFGIRVVTTPGSQGFNLIAIWAEIEKINPNPEALSKPDLTTIKLKYTADPEIPSIGRSRRLQRFGSIALVAVISAVAVLAFPPIGAFVGILIGLVVAGKLWNRANKRAAPLVAAYGAALKAYRDVELEFDRSSASPDSYKKTREQLETDKRIYEGLGNERAKRLAELNKEREAKQRLRFLEGHKIENAKIRLVGEKGKMILRGWGIEDASDVDPAKILRIDGFGQAKVTALVDWRKSVEKMFHFDPNQPVDPRDLHTLEQELTQRKQNLERSLREGPQSLRQSISVWQAQRRQQHARLLGLAEKLAQADVNRSALGLL